MESFDLISSVGSRDISALENCDIMAQFQTFSFSIVKKIKKLYINVNILLRLFVIQIGKIKVFEMVYITGLWLTMNFITLKIMLGCNFALIDLCHYSYLISSLKTLKNISAENNMWHANQVPFKSRNISQTFD